MTDKDLDGVVEPDELAKLQDVAQWATEMLIYLDIDYNDLPPDEFKIYEEGYDKTEAGLRKALADARSGAQNAVDGLAPEKEGGE